ncbi:hypothetical protein BASA81_008816 [Batrachochytrium salamandrivorans]|nr:hypothetical protein BASA81_008816 [Batrachochytrium salamandrivorans]
MSLCFRIQHLLGGDGQGDVLEGSDFAPEHSFGFRVRFASLLANELKQRFDIPCTYSQLLFPSPEDETRLLALFNAQPQLADRFSLLQRQYHANQSRLARMDLVLEARRSEVQRLIKAKLLEKNRDQNVAKLLELKAQALAKRQALEKEWYTVKQALEEDFKRKNLSVQHKLDVQLQVTVMKQELREILKRIQRPASSLSSDSALAPEAASERASVIARVLDCTKQVGKQQVEIDRLHKELSDLNKELAFATEQLEEMERETDELVFTKSTASAQVFEFLVELIERYDACVQLEDDMLALTLAIFDKKARLVSSSFSPL